MFLPPFFLTESDSRKKIIDYAEKCLAKAAEHQLIKPADQAGRDDGD